MFKEIIIGRDSDSSCLAILVDGKVIKDSSITLPNSVSRLKTNEKNGHCRLYLKEDFIKISNLNPQNSTFVDGEEIESSTIINKHSVVEIGADQYRISITKILNKIGYIPPISIKHLKRVWERYDRKILNLQMEQQKKANQQKLQGLISQASVLCVIIPSVMPNFPIPGIVRILLILSALALGVYFYIRGSKTDESFVVKKREIDEQFKEDYVCPKCGYFFGFIPYDNLAYKNKCPNPNCNAPLTT